jgi:hypothetical protein
MHTQIYKMVMYIIYSKKPRHIRGDVGTVYDCQIKHKSTERLANEIKVQHIILFIFRDNCIIFMYFLKLTLKLEDDSLYFVLDDRSLRGII